MSVPTPSPVSNHAVVGMSFDAERLEQRRQTLGASEIAAVAGLNRYRSAIDVWCEKRGVAEPFEGNEFTEWGLRMESVLAQKYGEVTQTTLRPSNTMIRSDEPWMSATPDRFVLQTNPTLTTENDSLLWGVEFKNKSAQQIVNWGETGSDSVPHDVAAQCYWSMLVTGMKWWDIAVLFGGNTFRHYRIHRDDDIAATFMAIGRTFWFDHVQTGVQPAIDGSKAAAAHLKKRFQSHTELVREATNEETQQVFKLRGLREEKKGIEADEDLVTNQLKEAIGEAAGIVCRGGRVTWKAPKPTSVVNWEAIAKYLAQLSPNIDINNVIAEHTTQRENTRRFLLTVPKD